MTAFFWVAYFFELLMIFSEQLQSLHHLGIGTGTFLGRTALLMPHHHLVYFRGNLARFSVGVGPLGLVVVWVWMSSRTH